LGIFNSEDHGSRPARAKSSQDPSQPTPEHNGICLPSQATQEAKIVRITVPGHLRHKKVHKNPPNRKKLSMVVDTCYSRYYRKHK
jgi:hypothetical protein